MRYRCRGRDDFARKVAGYGQLLPVYRAVQVHAHAHVPIRNRGEQVGEAQVLTMANHTLRFIAALLVVIAANIVSVSATHANSSCNWETSDAALGKQVQKDLREIFQDDPSYLEEFQGRRERHALDDGIIGRKTKKWLGTDHLCDAAQLFSTEPLKGLQEFAAASARHCGWRSTLMSKEFWDWREDRPNDTTKVENPVGKDQVEEQLNEYWNRSREFRSGNFSSYFELTEEDLALLENWPKAEKALCDLRQEIFTSNDDAEKALTGILGKLSPAIETTPLKSIMEEELKKYYGLSERAKAFFLAATAKTNAAAGNLDATAERAVRAARKANLAAEKTNVAAGKADAAARRANAADGDTAGVAKKADAAAETTDATAKAEVAAKKTAAAARQADAAAKQAAAAAKQAAAAAKQADAAAKQANAVVQKAKTVTTWCDAVLNEFALLEMTDEARLKKELTERLAACFGKLEGTSGPKARSDAADLVGMAENEILKLFEEKSLRLNDAFYLRLNSNEAFPAIASDIEPCVLDRLKEVIGVSYPTEDAFMQDVDPESMFKITDEKRACKGTARNWKTVRALAMKPVEPEQFDQTLFRLQAGNATSCKRQKGEEKVETYGTKTDVRYVFYPRKLVVSDKNISPSRESGNEPESSENGPTESWAIDFTAINRIGFWGLTLNDKTGLLEGLKDTDVESMDEAVGLALDYDVGVDLILYHNSWKEILAQPRAQLTFLANAVAEDALREAKQLLAAGEGQSVKNQWYSVNVDKPQPIGITVFFENFPPNVEKGANKDQAEKFRHFFKVLLHRFVRVMRVDEKEKEKYALHVVVPLEMFKNVKTSDYDYEFIKGLIADAKENKVQFHFLVFLAGNEPDAGGDKLAKDVRDMVRKIPPLPGDSETQGAKGDCYARGLSCRDFLNGIAPVFIWNAGESEDKDNEIGWARRRIEVASYDFGGVGLSAPPRLEDKGDGNAVQMYRIVKSSYEGACDKSVGEVCSTLVLPNQKWLYMFFDLLLVLIVVTGGVRLFTCWFEPYPKVLLLIVWSLLATLAVVSALLTCLWTFVTLPRLLAGIVVAAFMLFGYKSWDRSKRRT
jgi:hypothetical protein